MNDILTEDGLINIDPEGDRYRLNMRQRLDTIIRHPSGKDVFICPDFITPFDNNALFEWSKQLFGNTEDPVYTAYLDHVDEITDAYYEQYYKPYYREE